MPKYVCKVHRNGKQLRLAIPVNIIKEKNWFKEKYVVLETHPDGKIELRSFLYVDTKDK